MKRSRHHTGWAGALGVASELSRRMYDAAITLGNTPALDLICSSPGGKRFTVQVKTVSSHTWVLINKKYLEHAEIKEDLFYVVVFIPPDLNKQLEYYILTHAEVCKAYERQAKTRRDGKPYKPGMEGINWGDVNCHLGCWTKLPD